MATVLTDAERETLNAVEDIFKKYTPQGSSWILTPAFYDGEDRKFSFGSLTYFDSSGKQHGWLGGETFADRVQRALEIEDGVEKDAEIIHQREIARLRDQLDKLEKAA